MTSAQQVQIYRLAGIQPPSRSYTPATIGKLGKMRTNTNTLIHNLQDVTFTSPAELRAQTPEQVYWVNPVIPHRSGSGGMIYGQPDKKYRAIVGSQTLKAYSIMSDRYEPVQHADVLEAMALASIETGINIFGSVSDVDGRMHAHAWFADPSYRVQLLKEETDPFMLGVRVYNSHTGVSGFGAEIFGIRMICTNYNAWGASMGKIGWNHRVKGEDIIRGFADVVERCIDNVPVLADRMSAMADADITIDEAAALLWGISLSPSQVDAVIGNRRALNPEIKGDGKISIYDIYNASTAYNSYRSAGGNMIDGSVDLSHDIEKLMVKDTDDLLALGLKRKEKYDDAQKKKAPVLRINDRTRVVGA
jgi:hypothetical protein